ncbi:YecA family protein [Paenibacillus oleatilyticus]|uniref:SEC-C metal-binding domain-containing protein n=1 Tax=Paenibacillus oleatilyticus TaxID=2594886 RepID=A0ABV4V5B2_9BACL
MWKKMFRSRVSLDYRKRFICPECGSNSLYIIHDSACECENGCDGSLINIHAILRNDNFDGYFTSAYIREHFWVDDEKMNQMLAGIIEDNRYKLLSNSEKQKIKTFLFNRTSRIEEKLDDLVVEYLNANTLRKVPSEMTVFGYLINLLEDMHFFMNLCCKDLALFNCGILFASKQFYSGRFFYNNAIEHLFLANERLYVILGILYNYNFDDDLSLNKSYKIEKYIKDSTNYRDSDIKKILDSLKSNRMYDTLKSMRKINTHDLSYFSKKIEDEIKKDAVKAQEFWNRDGDEVDSELYLPQIRNLIFCLEKHYDLLDLVLIKINSETDVDKINPVPMIKKFMNKQVINITKQYTVQEIQELEFHKIRLFRKLPQYDGTLIGDIFFRLNEVVRCIFDYCHIENEIFYQLWISKANLKLNDLMDRQYLLYSALSRIYSCYDKLSRYLAHRYPKYSEVKYFQDFMKKSDKSPLFNKINEILNDKYYKQLYELRNDIYHNLRAGALHGDEGLIYFDNFLFVTVYENTKTIFKFIEYLNVYGNQKVGRNEPCLCGSGLKYKKCCG